MGVPRRAESTTAAVAIRPFNADDAAFLFRTWLGSYRKADHVKSVESIDFFPGHHSVIERILERPSTRAIVACLPEDESIILGYAVAEGDVLHYVYTKENLRRFGIASALLAAIDLPPSPRTSHATAAWFQYLRPRYPGSRWNPYLVG